MCEYAFHFDTQNTSDSNDNVNTFQAASDNQADTREPEPSEGKTDNSGEYRAH